MLACRQAPEYGKDHRTARSCLHCALSCRGDIAEIGTSTGHKAAKNYGHGARTWAYVFGNA